MSGPLALLPCLSCGHPAVEHETLDFGVYMTHDGARIRDIRLGACRHVDEGQLLECFCTDWDPDTLSHVSELLGLDIRRVIL